MKIKTSELEGAALDWAVAKAVGQDFTSFLWIKTDLLCDRTGEWIEDQWSPSTDWSQGGPLIDRYIGIAMRDTRYPSEPFYAETKCTNLEAFANGATFLIAAMRAIVTAELGDEVDVPEELLS